MAIRYKTDQAITAQQYITLLNQCSLGIRRPLDDVACMTGMVKNSNILVTAWDEDCLVGVARGMTDFHYACYLSDLAVSQDYQGQGIGKQLQRLVQQQLGPRCSVILLAAPAANDYYQPLGYQHNPRCWILSRDQAIPDTV
ncbi:MAG: GNAT family N-acetyltransferase [Paraglaciecola sp.]|nr:GNAT family N-acetyltransferase [Paraglaciecola sp.]